MTSVRTIVVLTCAVGLLNLPGLTASRSRQVPASAAGVDAALRTVVPDIGRRVARFKTVRMPFDRARLSEREQQMIAQLVVACQKLESMFWRQSDADALALVKALDGADTPVARDLRRYLIINGSRWDLVDENRPFVGSTPMPPGRMLYPADVTRQEIESYVAAHPDAKAPIYDPYTIVRRQADRFIATPYHEEFKALVADAAEALRRAASLSDDEAFARFLRLRADALGTDDYYASDVAWLDLQNPKIDIIFAPYETYLDDLLGVKTSYGGAILVRNEEETRNLAVYQQWIPDIQDSLPLAAAERPSVRGHATPMEVMDAPFRAGDLRHGYQAVADNLPNDPRIHAEKGTKKIFFKNFMDARVREIILPMAIRLMDPAQARHTTAAGYMATTILHEIAHGLGPAFARDGDRQTDIREAIGGAYSALEEAKADVVGLFGLKWLVDHGVLPATRIEEYYASDLAEIFRTVRFGTGEAHGRAEIMQFNYLSEQGAVEKTGGRYRVDVGKMTAALARLAKELLEQEATGDRARTESWFARYDRMPDDLRQALGATGDVPVDIDPMFELPDRFE